MIELPNIGSHRPSIAESHMPSSYSSLNDLSSYAVIKDVLYLPSVGVLFPACGEVRLEIKNPSSTVDETRPPVKPPQPKVLLRCVSAGQFDSRNLMKGRHNGESSQLGSHGEHVRLIVTPEIQISSTDGQASSTESGAPVKNQRPRLHSHSPERLEPSVAEESNLLRASSETSLGSNPISTDLKNSKSDDAGLFLLGTNVLDNSKKIPPINSKFSMSILASPSSSLKGNPLAMLAKGVQNLGQNLDPRKMLDTKKLETSSSTEKDDEEGLLQTKLCTNTRIIHL